MIEEYKRPESGYGSDIYHQICKCCPGEFTGCEEMGNPDCWIVKGQKARDIIESAKKIMDHSFGDGWRNPSFLSVDYEANDSVDGMQDMAKVLRGEKTREAEQK